MSQTSKSFQRKLQRNEFYKSIFYQVTLIKALLRITSSYKMQEFNEANTGLPQPAVDQFHPG